MPKVFEYKKYKFFFFSNEGSLTEPCHFCISANEARATKVEFGADSFSVTLLDGRILSVPKAWFPALCDASAAQLDNYVLSGGGIGIHWDELDEDILVPGLLLGTPSAKFTA